MEKVVGLPELLLVGTPGYIGMLPLLPPVAPLFGETSKGPGLQSDSRGNRAKGVPLWQGWGLPPPLLWEELAQVPRGPGGPWA